MHIVAAGNRSDSSHRARSVSHPSILTKMYGFHEISIGIVRRFSTYYLVWGLHMFGCKKASSSRPAGVPSVPGNARPGHPPATRAARQVNGPGTHGASWRLPPGTTARPTVGPSGPVLAYDPMRLNAVVGQAANFKPRTVNSISGNNVSVSVWNFNVVRHDSHGNQEHPMMPVEMRGWRPSEIPRRKDRAVLLIPAHPMSAVATASTQGNVHGVSLRCHPEFLPLHNRVNNPHWSVSFDVWLSLVSNPTGRDHGEWRSWS